MRVAPVDEISTAVGLPAGQSGGDPVGLGIGSVRDQE